MRIFLNGESYDAEGSADVESLLARLGLERHIVAVELNEAILSKQRYDTVIVEGDRVEIVHFVGGG